MRLLGPLGIVWFVQVVPPLVVPRIAATTYVVGAVFSNRLTGCRRNAAEMPAAGVSPVGTVRLVQVDPPSVVPMIAIPEIPPLAEEPASPTASQTVLEEQEMPLRAITPLGTVWLVQVAPPSVVPTNTTKLVSCLASVVTAASVVADCLTNGRRDARNRPKSSHVIARRWLARPSRPAVGGVYDADRRPTGRVRWRLPRIPWRMRTKRQRDWPGRSGPSGSSRWTHHRWFRRHRP